MAVDYNHISVALRWGTVQVERAWAKTDLSGAVLDDWLLLEFRNAEGLVDRLLLQRLLLIVFKWIRSSSLVNLVVHRHRVILPDLIYALILRTRIG